MRVETIKRNGEVERLQNRERILMDANGAPIRTHQTRFGLLFQHPIRVMDGAVVLCCGCK